MRNFFSKIYSFPFGNAKSFYSTRQATKVRLSEQNRGTLIISCKHSELNHYSSDFYDKFQIVPHASKGWKHSKSNGDYFVIHPYEQESICNIYSWNLMGLHPNIIQKLCSDGIKNATEFQFRAYDAIKTGPHVLLAAETGSGKTLAYLSPIIQNLLESKSQSQSLNTPKAVILLPNRELAYQIGEVAENLGSVVGITAKVVVGGKTKSVMMNPDFQETDVLIATPGALGKLSTVGIYKLNEVRYLVLDEADTLLDNSFIEVVTRLTGRMAQSKIILSSATIPQTLPGNLSSLENNMQHIISPKIHRPLLNITQKFMRLTSSRKPSHLLQICKINKEPMIIFTNKNETCNWVALFLRENGIPCSNINGDMNYALRIDQWNQFVRRDTDILAATDVASRGLNTIQVKQLLNYDFPLYAADYIHRIGRIGRLGGQQSCKATNFIVNEREINLVQQIELAIRRNQPLQNVDGNITRLVENRKKRIEKETAW